MSLDTIEALLTESNPRFAEGQVKIVKSISMYSVAIFATSRTGREEVLSFAGSGTLVYHGGAHHILTALHVWEEGFGHSSKLGISLRNGVYHRFFMDRETIIPLGPPKPSNWSEAGPDFVLLRIPDIHVGTIKANKVFYNLSIAEPTPPNVEHIKAWFLIGAPACLGTFLQKTARVGFRGFHVGFRQVPGFIEALVNVADLPSSQSVEGVSGGGLWKVLLYESSPGEPVESVAILRGVAFWEFPLEDNTRVVRCHGIDCIRSLAAGVAESRR
jgi:hypothetical protein